MRNPKNLSKVFRVSKQFDEHCWKRLCDEAGYTKEAEFFRDLVIALTSPLSELDLKAYIEELKKRDAYRFMENQ